jgi:hypothetical protein
MSPGTPQATSAVADAPVLEGAGAARDHRRRYGVLLASTLALLAVQGIVPPSRAQEVVVAALAGASVVLACRAAQLSPRMVRLATIVGGVVVVLGIVRATAGGVSEGAARLGMAALVALGPPAVAVGVVRDLRTSGRVRLEAVSGVLCLYLLLGLLFAYVYGAIDRLGDDSFFAGAEDGTLSRCLYFSFTTLTTVGYGDLVAGSNLGRTLAIFEALLGQIYLVTVVSLIVSNLGRPARADRRSASQ